MMVDDTLAILPADKGNATVVMDREAYDSKMRAGQNLETKDGRTQESRQEGRSFKCYSSTHSNYTTLHAIAWEESEVINLETHWERSVKEAIHIKETSRTLTHPPLLYHHSIHSYRKK